MQKSKSILLNCQQATLLISKKQQAKLSLKQGVQLNVHLLVCKLCKRFQHQTNIIGQLAKKLQQQQRAVLSPQKKQLIQQLLDDAQQ